MDAIETVDIFKLFGVLEKARNHEIDKMITCQRRKEYAGRRHSRKGYEYWLRKEKVHRNKMNRLNITLDELSLHWEDAAER